jgi:hypothetical protein
MIASSDDETIAPSRSWNSFGGPGITTTVLTAARIGESMSMVTQSARAAHDARFNARRGGMAAVV